MKAWKAGAVVLLGMALAGPVGGHSNAALLEEWFTARSYDDHLLHPNAVPFTPEEGRIVVWRDDRARDAHSLHAWIRIQGFIKFCYRNGVDYSNGTLCRLSGPGISGHSLYPDPEYWSWPRDARQVHSGRISLEEGGYDAEHVFAVLRFREDDPPTVPRDSLYHQYIDAVRHIHYRTPSDPDAEPPPEPSVSCGEPTLNTDRSATFLCHATDTYGRASFRQSPNDDGLRLFFYRPVEISGRWGFTAVVLRPGGRYRIWLEDRNGNIQPGEAPVEHPQEPDPEPPEPETPPEPEAPERCAHVAIVPAMPRALSGDEGSPDHWLRISNPGAESITFTVTGRNDAGDPHPRSRRGLTGYRRELPAYKSIQVNMRDVEAAFDVEPEGWWRLVVTGSGPLEVVATMRQGAERRFVPVRTPATCTSGPVTRAGG